MMHQHLSSLVTFRDFRVLLFYSRDDYESLAFIIQERLVG